MQTLVSEALADAAAPTIAVARTAGDDAEEKERQQQRRAAVLPVVESFSSTDVAVLLSGGVDSSVALSLLQKQVGGSWSGFVCVCVCDTNRSSFDLDACPPLSNLSSRF